MKYRLHEIEVVRAMGTYSIIRMAVKGGWLYCIEGKASKSALTFIPDTEVEIV